ncbi:Uncharacterised protein [Acholeplasma oculi]|uniref:Uncharacterized protein n=1 Tax=Acholeplasma oculi TaxID=35623 RepID=A0A061AAX3_9MOLU|nr:hypothetical protein [Acholeplasma oculi]CDR30998.1 hypothetical protein Aocu_09250 [Acholeplasma oculi]SKC36143.1 hypothetical protein SAMN02745122_0350 [Acholeplasma oculi]SUT90421.1 Uncharacterised protein [Acholeplasma oculi]
MKYLIKLFNEANIIRRRLDEYTDMKVVILSTLVSMLLTSLSVAPLVLIIIPLFLITELQILLIILLFIIGIASVFLYQYLLYYIQGIQIPKILGLNTKKIVYLDSIIISTVLIMVGLIVTFSIYGGLA